jgi:pimeloyl-ACP methyl ester carboxylesterase
MTPMKHYILYIPGLGDSYDRFRKIALRPWSVFGVKAQLLPMAWYDGRSYHEKYRQANATITRLIQSGATVSLVGESAGGSMAINLFAAHPKIAHLITVAGVNKPSTSVAPRTLRRAPAFAVSRQYLADSLPRISDKRRRDIYTLSALIDHVVAAQYSRMSGARNRRVWSVGHLLTIALCLTLLSGYIVWLARRPTSV